MLFPAFQQNMVKLQNSTGEDAEFLGTMYIFLASNICLHVVVTDRARYTSNESACEFHFWYQ
jgi:hypothetical protein